MRALRWIGAAGVLLVLPAAVALAQDGENEAPSAIERARDHMERGQALYLQARFEEAAAEFEAAYEAQPFSAFLYNAGVALERAGQPGRAADLFEQYLGRDPGASDAESVRARVARLRASQQAPPSGAGERGSPEGAAAAAEAGSGASGGAASGEAGDGALAAAGAAGEGAPGRASDAGEGGAGPGAEAGEGEAGAGRRAEGAGPGTEAGEGEAGAGRRAEGAGPGTEAGEGEAGEGRLAEGAGRGAEAGDGGASEAGGGSVAEGELGAGRGGEAGAGGAGEGASGAERVAAAGEGRLAEGAGRGAEAGEHAAGAAGAGEGERGPGATGGPAGARQAAAAPPDGIPDDFKSLLSVRTNPEGATIRVQRADATLAEGPAPFAHTLEQGRYHVVVEHPDYQTVEQDVRIEPGKVYVVIVEMSQGQFLGYLRVVSNVPGADVYIDDREQGPRGQTPFEAPIPVGPHQIWVERPGYQPEQREVEVGIGEDVTTEIALERVDFGRLRVVANVPGARVVVDDRQLGTVPFEAQLPAGPHRLRVEADGMKSWETDVTIERGQLTPTRVRLRPAVGRGGAWVTTVFGALFLGGGIALGLVADDLSTTLAAEQEAGTLASDDSRLDLGFYLSIGADAAFGLSAILGALALYYFVYDPLPPSEGRALEARDWALSPMLDPVRGTAGLGVEGRF
jgi:hypothetical protein